MTTTELSRTMARVKQCDICLPSLAHGVRPVYQVSATAKILIAGQAPGAKVHATGIPFDDPSGDRLRHWLGIDKSVFYDASKIAILPMGFCYPGKGKSGDLPPRKECANQWRSGLLSLMPNIELTIIIGQYAIHWHLPKLKGQSLTDVVLGWREHAPENIPLPHPSPRNNIWLKKNSWFEADVVPQLRIRVSELLD